MHFALVSLDSGGALTHRVDRRRHLKRVGVNSANFLAEKQPEIGPPEGRDWGGAKSRRDIDKRRMRRMARASARLKQTNNVRCGGV